jgi:hypothetical protein
LIKTSCVGIGGKALFITDLRPDTVIKDEAIPELLRHQKQATFVTINEKDFWLKTAPDNRYCIICFVLSDTRAVDIPQQLQILFRQPPFKTKASRMGKIIRKTYNQVSYYVELDRHLIQIPLL